MRSYLVKKLLGLEVAGCRSLIKLHSSDNHSKWDKLESGLIEDRYQLGALSM